MLREARDIDVWRFVTPTEVAAMLDRYVYWGINGHDIDGGVRRVRKRGGLQERIRGAGVREDRVKRIVPYPKLGILVVGESTVGWIRGNEDKATTLFKSETFIGDAVADDRYAFVAEKGRKHDQRPGYIYRVAIETGAILRLTGPLEQPSKIATHGDREYFMLDTAEGVWSVPKAGGEVTKAVSGDPYDREQGEASLGLWAHECGLLWLQGNSVVDSTKTLRFVPW
jgi:hypothetical protein